MALTKPKYEPTHTKARDKMYCIAIDPGSNKFGYAIMKLNNGELIEQGTIHLNRGPGSSEGIDLPTRLGRAYKAVDEILDRYPGLVTEGCFEEAFLGENVRSTMVISMARGVLMSPLLSRNIPITDYPTKTAKSIALGTGRATKEDGIRLMQLEFSSSGLVDELTEDAADAMIVGKAHIIVSRTNARLSQNVSTAPQKSMAAYRRSDASNLTASRGRHGGAKARGSRDAWTKQFSN